MNLEVDRMRSIRNYRFYAEWITFFEQNAGIIRDNIVSLMCILKTGNGNVGDAQIRLKVASKACYNIHRLNNYKLTKFESLYSKMNEKKLIKPILESLRRSGGVFMFLSA